MMKKITAILSTVMALGLSAAAFSGCNFFENAKAEEGRVMNLSLNPQVEFVLDGNDKVVTVNALNEEGNLIISAAAFENVEGKTAEEAAKLFVQVSAETGYLVSGSVSVGDNQIDISFSGDVTKAKELYDEAVAKMQEVFNEENITAKVNQAKAITEEKLRELLEECAPYIETAEMKYGELIDALVAERKETAEFYSQELKKAYYEQKEFIMQQSEIETLKSHLNSVSQIAVDVANVIYSGLVEGIEKTRETMLVNEDSPYQQALAYFRTVKTEYLKMRYEYISENVNVSITITEEQYNAMKAKLEDAEAKLISAAATANEQLDKAKEKITEAYNKVIATIEEYSVKVNDHLDEIAVKQQEKKEQFFTEFESKYAEAKAAAEKHWQNMHGQLESSEESAK